MRSFLTGLAIVALIGANAAAPAQTSKPKKGDPSEVVCEKIEVIGSRVAAKRVCATRAEWAEKRQQDRDVIDQAQRAANGPCSSVNTHSGTPAC